MAALSGLVTRLSLLMLRLWRPHQKEVQFALSFGSRVNEGTGRVLNSLLAMGLYVLLYDGLFYVVSLIFLVSKVLVLHFNVVRGALVATFADGAYSVESREAWI